MAEYERRGAALERRWVELVADDKGLRTVPAAELVISHARQGAKQLSAVLSRTADALERSAGLAEEHAQRRDRAGQSDDAAVERQAAEHAREGARRARSQAEEWLMLSESPKCQR